MVVSCEVVSVSMHCNQFVAVMNRDHSFPQQIFPNAAGQFAKFCGSPRQIFHASPLMFCGRLNPTKYAVIVTGSRN